MAPSLPGAALEYGNQVTVPVKGHLSPLALTCQIGAAARLSPIRFRRQERVASERVSNPQNLRLLWLIPAETLHRRRQGLLVGGKVHRHPRIGWHQGSDG